MGIRAATLDRQHVLALLVRAALLVTFVVTGAQLWTRDLGMDERLVGRARIVGGVDPDGPAARAGIVVGDEILADPGLESDVADRTEREAYESAFRLGRAMKQGAVPVRIRHDTADRWVTIVPESGPSIAAAVRHLQRLGSQLPVAFAFLGVALLLARRRSRSERDERARFDVGAGCALLGASWVGAWPEPAWPLWLYPATSLLENVASAIGIVLLARFAWSYPTRSRLVDHRALRVVVVGIGMPTATFSVLNSLHVIGAPPGLHGNTANMAFTGTMGLATLVGLVWQRARAVDLIARRQSTWLLSFCGVGIVVPIALLLVPHYGFSLPAPPFVQVFALAFPLFIPVGFATVVTRFRLFSLDGVAVHAVAYAIAVVASLLVCVLVTLGIDAAYTSRAGGDESRWVGMIAALVLVEPLRRGSQVLLDRAFSRDRDEFLRRCAELASRVTPLSDRTAIEDEVRATLDATTVRLLAFREVLEGEAARSVDIALARSSVLRVVDLHDPSAVDALRERGFELLVAVPTGSAGEDGDGDGPRALALTLPGGVHAIARAERDALALVGRVVAAALARDVAWRMLQAEITRADQERRQIAMDLHDGIGATLVAARSMTRRLRTEAGNVKTKSLDALDQTLREGLGDLRASLTGLDPADSEWDAVVAHLRRHVSDQCAAEGIAVTLSSTGDGTTRLAPAGRLAVLRVVQEAVSNAVKHASPRHLTIRMELDELGIEVAVEDDGCGGARLNGVGRGLGNIFRRVESLGGEVRLDDAVPNGTRVTMSLPASALVFATTGASASGVTRAAGVPAAASETEPR